MPNISPVLEVKGLKTYFQTEDGVLRAVDDVSFCVGRGETLGVVGESGCGKSVTAKSILQLLPRPKAKIVSGEILYYGSGDTPIDIAKLDPHGNDMRNLRGNEISMIFQEPMTSLNPVYTIGDQIIESVCLHLGMNKKAARQRAIEMLERVGIPDPAQRVDQYPHEFSGGMRQRAMIAMALSCNPQFIIADEPTTALDVTVEAQIMNLMADLQQEFGMSIMLITHDLGVIADMADRVVVMYSGTVVETGTTEEIFHNPRHPYTQGLLASIPKVGEDQRLVAIPGTVPNLKNLPPNWCYFAPRCTNAKDRCAARQPPLVELSSGRMVRCWSCAMEVESA